MNFRVTYDAAAWLSEPNAKVTVEVDAAYADMARRIAAQIMADNGMGDAEYLDIALVL